MAFLCVCSCVRNPSTRVEEATSKELRAAEHERRERRVARGQRAGAARLLGLRQRRAAARREQPGPARVVRVRREDALRGRGRAVDACVESGEPYVLAF